MSALLAMLLTGGVILWGVWLLLSYKKHRIQGALSGVRTRKKVSTLRAGGQLEGDVTFADAIKVHETGTLRRKTSEDKIVDSVAPVEMLFESDDHGLYYQFEKGEWNEKQVASWVEVSKALDLADISGVLEEVMRMRDVICHPEYDGQAQHGDEQVHSVSWRRASELRVRIESIDGIARLRAACEAHLRRNAPAMLPLPAYAF